MRIIVSYNEDTGINEQLFEPEFRKKNEWVEEWLDDGEELDIVFDVE